MTISTDKTLMDKEMRQALLNSESGVKLANIEVINLFSDIKNIIALDPDEVSKKKKVTVEHRVCLIKKKRFSLQLVWDSKYKNTLEGSALYVKLWSGNPSRNTLLFAWARKPKLIEEKIFTFNLESSGDRGWKELGSSKPMISKVLAQLMVKMLDDADYTEQATA